MTTIALGMVIFLNLLSYLIIADIILSWLSLAGIRVRPKFLSDIIDPMYERVKSILPTTIGPIDFTPIVLFIAINFLKSIIFLYFPEILELRQ